MTLHPIPPGLWCVPSALYAITGADWDSVLHPALNRHSEIPGTDLRHLTDVVSGSTVNAARATLEELGYAVRRYKHAGKKHVRTWAEMSKERYPGRTLLLFTRDHCLVAEDGRVYDSWLPHGPPGMLHPFAKTTVTDCFLVHKK